MNGRAADNHINPEFSNRNSHKSQEDTGKDSLWMTGHSLIDKRDLRRLLTVKLTDPFPKKIEVISTFTALQPSVEGDRHTKHGACAKVRGQF